MTNARNLANLLGGSTTISIESLSADIPITEKFATSSLLPATGTVGEQAFVEETNRLYIWNGSGWYSIALINTTPTWDPGGQPAGAYVLDGDSPQTATTITLAASDPEGLPISYTYVTSGQMDSISTISQDSSVFTITPKTSAQAPDGGTGSITFRASDGINILPQVSSFTLNIITTVADSNHTTLLATATNGTSESYSLSGALYDSITLDTSSESTGYQIFAFNNDGTKLFRISSATGQSPIIYQYTLTTGFDLSTGSYDNVSYTIPSNQGSDPRAIQFNNDGTKMYVYTSSNTRISQYALTNGFDLSDVSYDNKLYNGTTGNSGFTFNNDGSKLFKATGTSKTIETYNLSEAFNISTASDANVSFSTASQTSNTAFQVQFNSNGTKMFVMDWVNSAGNNIYQYTLTQPYVVSSATYNNVSYNYNSQESSPNDFKFNNNGTKMYIGGFATDRIHQYSTVLHGNSNITDSSSNNHSITVTGDTHAGTFSPYRSGGYSTYFDGNGDNLDISASSDFDFGTGDFTFEMSFYAYVTSGGGKLLITNRASGWGAGVFQFQVSAAATNVYCTFYPYDLGGYSIVPETWYHISAVKSGDTITLYLNGTTPTASSSYTQSHSGVNNVSMGSSSKDIDIGSNGTSDYFKGYIRDIRIVKGTAITPPSGGPTERLEAVTNTSLLTCHLPYISDGSTNNHSITVNGDVSTKPFSPYDYEEYSAADHGGSVYFDGSGDYLDIAGSTSLDLDGTNWTIEGWVYRTGTGTSHTFVNTASPHNTLIISLNRTNNGDTQVFTGNGSSWVNTSAINSGTNYPILANTWSHIALVKNGNSIYLYHNGNSVGSSTDVPSGFTGNVRVGAYEDAGSSGQHLTGYVSDFRVTKSAVYSGVFTPPSGPLTATGGTYPSTTNVDTSITAALHIKGTDASIIDKSQGSNLKLEGNTTGSTTQVKFAGSKSMYFDGTGDYISIPADDRFVLGSDAMTIEFWLNLSSSADSWARMVECGSYNENDTWHFAHPSNTSNISFIIGHTSTRPEIVTTTSLSYGTWYHIAVARSGNTLKLFLDGTQEGGDLSYSGSFVGPDHGALLIGTGSSSSSSSTPQNFMNGYIQDLRVTKGLARYTAADETANIPSAPLEG